MSTPHELGNAKRIAFLGGNDDFRAARLRCSLACAEYNKLPEDASAEQRAVKWLHIVDSKNKALGLAGEGGGTASEPIQAVPFSELFRARGARPGVPSTATTSPPRPTIPYVKTPVQLDYGLRVRIAPTTFINRNCTILDTPVADIVIGEQCNIGPGVTIVGVGHPVRFEERCEFLSGRPGSWGAGVVVGDGVWIGAGATILPGVSIGSYSTIGAGSVVTKDIPPRCMAAGNPAVVHYSIDGEACPKEDSMTAAETLEEALKVGREEGKEGEEGE